MATTTALPEGIVLRSVPALPEGIVLRSVEAKYTAAHWEQMPDDGWKYEIINGELWMSTSPSGFHMWASKRINRALEDQLEMTGVAIVYYVPMGVFMPGCDPVQPDLFVVRQEDRAIFRDKHTYGVPALVVEILSPGSVAYDTQVKREAYAKAGVPEYWIVRPAERDVLVHTEPEPATGQYLNTFHVLPDGELVSPTLPFRARIAEFFAGAPDTTL